MATQTAFVNEQEFNFNDQSSEESINDSPDDSQVSEYLGSEDEQYPRRTSGVTKTISKTAHPRKKYRCISDNLREKLIDAVETRGLKIKQAAKKLRINYSSAKSIYQVYKKEGRLSKKIMKKRASKSHEEPELKVEVNIKGEEGQNDNTRARVKKEADSESSEINDGQMVVTKTEETELTLAPSGRSMVKTEENSYVKTEFDPNKIVQPYIHNTSSSNFNCPPENNISPTNTLSTSNAPYEGENLTQIDNSPLKPDLSTQKPPLNYNPYYGQNGPLIPNIPFMANNNLPVFDNSQALQAQNMYMQSLFMNQYNPQYAAYMNPMNAALFASQQQQQQQRIINTVVQEQNAIKGKKSKKTKK